MVWRSELVAPGVAHTVPLGDVIEHERTSDCECGPRRIIESPHGVQYVHHSLDGREHTEPDHDRAACGCAKPGRDG